MQVIEVKEFGTPEVLKLAERPTPRPGKGQLVIRVEAIGVNPVETYIRAGNYPRLPELPYVPGGNVAGTVADLGPDVHGWQVGDRVYSAATLSGAYAEMALCTVDQVFELAENLSYSQGAAIGVPAATAWRGLFIRGAGKKGERVLIHGASGSVGQAAVQLAAGAKMTVFGTAGSREGCDLVARLGAASYNHNHPDYAATMLQATGNGFDLILEMLANKNLQQDLELLAPGGRVVVIGSRGKIEIDPRTTMGKEADIRGLAIFNSSREEMVKTHQGLADAISAGILAPLVAREMDLADAALAHELVMKDGNCGKIVLKPRGAERENIA